MLFRLIRLGPPAKEFIRLHNGCSRIIDELFYKNSNLETKSSVTVKKIKRYTYKTICSIEINKNSGFQNDLNRKSSLCYRTTIFQPQKRHFSFESNVESIARTQTGIFKTLSESTPVEYCQKFLLTMHDYTGLPWWASIICSTILLRTVITLPLAVYQQYILAKLENLKLELPELVEELKKETALAVKMFGWDERVARATYNRSLRKQWNNLIVRDNCHPFKSTLLLWFQIPLWVSLSISFRNLVYMLPYQDLNAQLTFTELSVGGFGFIPNLTTVDSSWIFPVMLGIINLAIIEIQILSKAEYSPNKIQKFLTNTFRVLSVLMVPISASVPSCLVLYWTASSSYGLMQNLLLMSPKVKRFCKIPKTVTEIRNPYQMIVTNFKARLK